MVLNSNRNSLEPPGFCIPETISACQAHEIGIRGKEGKVLGSILETAKH